MPSDNPVSKLKTAIHKRKAASNVIPNNERTVTITFRVTADEKMRLDARCEGIERSDYIRARLFDYPLPRRKAVMSDINREVRHELKRVAASIQQQTKLIEKAMASGLQLRSADIKAQLNELKNVTKLVNAVRTSLDNSTLGGASDDNVGE